MKRILVGGGAALLLIGLILLAIGATKGGGQPGKLVWSTPDVKSALMTVAYKAYGNRKVENGRLYLSKITFKNEGEQPIQDFSISYKLEGYVPWTEPEIIHAVPPGFSFVKLFYPRLPAEVSKLRTATNTTLYTKVHWKENGRDREEDLSHDVLLRAVNEISYSDLPQSEIQSWQDAFNASMFSVAMVTPNDPVVDLYASEITKAAGGTTAGIEGGGKEVYRLCKTAYDYMCRTGLRYTGDSGVPANFDNIATLVQTVRLPRDVIINNNGLCIELALLWSSLLEHLGVKAALVYRPGHAYVIAYAPNVNMPLSDGLPIECTAITPRAVGKEQPVSFDEAVKMSSEDLERFYKQGTLMIMPVDQYQQMGFTAPELPDVDIPKLSEMLSKRLGPDNGQQPSYALNRAPNQNGSEAPAGEGSSWEHPQGYVSVSLPASFTSVRPAVNPGNVLLLVAGDPSTSVECDVMQVNGTQDPKRAFEYIISSFKKVGVHIKVDGSAGQGEDGRFAFYGRTTSRNANNRWVCAGKAIPDGVVFAAVGASARAWQSQSGTVEAVFKGIQFK
ncbi:MAG: hypothetical protein JO354_01435 [Verrucomicrobia bacterium]|nr:hypothetical protein [Verrucomicrobiota bacterium]